MAQNESDAVRDELEIVSIEAVDGEFDVFDITVDVDECFIVAGAIVHNCIQCASLDLVEFPINSGPRPPAHFVCRCATIPTFKGALSQLRGGQRPSVGDDGAESVSGNTNYFNWLKTQPLSFQSFAIGPSRAALLRNGGLSASRFAQMNLDKRFTPLNLAEMKRIEPTAFDDAGIDA